MRNTPRTLEQMINRPTTYEIAISVNGSTEIVAYTQRTTERALRSTLGQIMNDEREARMTSAMTEEELDSQYEYNRLLGRIYFSENVWIGKTGRTERDAA